MERISNLNTERLDWLCQERGVSRDEMAAAVGIAKSTIRALFDGSSGLTFNQLKKLAAYFDQGVLFLLEQQPIIEKEFRSPAFRTLTNRKPDVSPVVKSIIRRAERQRELFLSLQEELQSDIPKFDPPKFNDQLNPAEKAEVAREWLGLSNNSAFDEYRSTLESRGILVFRSNGYAGKWQIPKSSPVLGFSLYFETFPLIFVRKQDPEARQTFTLMHELGHILLHHSSVLDDAGDVDFSVATHHENDANVFAGNILVTNDHLREVSDSARPSNTQDYPDWLEPLRRKVGVSTDVILFRLVEAQRLSRDNLIKYFRNRQPLQDGSPSGTRQYRHREPRHLFGDYFVKTVFDALSTQQITLNKASRYLDGLKLADIHKLRQYSVIA